MSYRIGWSSSQRVGVFIDTQNLYHSARDFYDRTVNFESLLEYSVRGRNLIRATAYVVEKDGDTSAWPFIYKLSTLGYRVRRMTLQVHQSLDGLKTTWVGNWDMGICADLVRLADKLDVIVLGSGDGDFVDILTVLMDRGIRVEVVAFKETTSQKLIDAADKFTHLPDIDHPFMPLKERIEYPRYAREIREVADSVPESPGLSGSQVPQPGGGESNK